MRFIILALLIVSPAFSEGQFERLLFSEDHKTGEVYKLNYYEYESLVAVYGKALANEISRNITWDNNLPPLVSGRYYKGKITVNPALARNFRDNYTIVHEGYHYFTDKFGYYVDRSEKTYIVDCMELVGGKLTSEQEAEVARAIGILQVGHKTMFSLRKGINNMNFDLVFLQGSIYGYAERYMHITIPESRRNITYD